MAQNFIRSVYTVSAVFEAKWSKAVQSRIALEASIHQGFRAKCKLVQNCAKGRFPISSRVPLTTQPPFHVLSFNDLQSFRKMRFGFCSVLAQALQNVMQTKAAENETVWSPTQVQFLYRHKNRRHYVGTYAGGKRNWTEKLDIQILQSDHVLPLSGPSRS